MIKPAKLLNDYLKGLVIIDKPIMSEFNRLSDSRVQKYLISDSNDKFSSDIDNFIFDISPEASFANLARVVATYSKNIKFNLMVIPFKAFEYSRLDFCDNVVIRVIEYYEIRIDQILTRYDILIEKVTDNG